MKELDLNDILARCEAATRGPWTTDAQVPPEENDPEPTVVAMCHEGTLADCDIVVAEVHSGGGSAEANAQFIAHAREDVPALLAALSLRATEETAVERRLLDISRRVSEACGDLSVELEAELQEVIVDAVGHPRRGTMKDDLDAAKSENSNTPEGWRCGECGRVVATKEDEAIHNTGECGCTSSRALCWRRWNGGRCVRVSPYDPSARNTE